ncbi:hypothetical protein IE53DRAFT_384757 [Violaceomyces palustris]|uniref:Uncharacterized protein n=1 Tax=Violaceomyces palustris TaxID=1673888 RepID=A0ACD0P4A6_9BASI|nr:hypothetical protein IE53DRAFT_384757 [Violaceomyces palustris]
MSFLRQTPSILAPLRSTSTLQRSIYTSIPSFNSSSSTSPSPVSVQSRDLPAEQLDRQQNAVQADAISDAPAELHQRTVRIFRPTKTANSSGKAGTKSWKIDWDILQGSARWENPLMGWASS